MHERTLKKNIYLCQQTYFKSFFLESFSKFIGVEELMYFCEADIKQLGVRNSAHRARIVSSLVALRDKHERGKLSSMNFLCIDTNCLRWDRRNEGLRPNRHHKCTIAI